MGNTHICTVGWEKADRIVKSMLRYAPPDKVYLIYGEPGGMDKYGKAKKVAEEVKKILEESYTPIPIEFIGIKDPHSPKEIWDALDQIISKEKKEQNEIFVNVSSGTKVMVVTSIMYSVLNEDVDIRIYYGIPEEYPISEKEDAYTSVGCKEVVEIPRLTPSLQRIFLDEDRTTLTVLRKIAENEVYESIEKLKEDTNLKRSTLKYHLDILEKLNFIEIVRKGKKSIIRITKLGKTCAKILVR